MATYKPYRKTTNGKEEINIPYSVLSNPPDLSVYAKLAGGNTFTGKQTLNSPASDGYSINAAGYIKGSWLQASATSNKGSNTGKVCVFDNSGWIYYRTPSEILAEAGGAKASDIKNGALTIQKNGSDVATFTANQSSSVTANITVPTKVSDLTNDSGYITSDGSVKSVIDYNKADERIKIGYAGESLAVAEIKYIAGYTAGDSESVARIKDIPKDRLKSWLEYATVATSGSYNDLVDKPTIPTFSLSGTTLTITTN